MLILVVGHLCCPQTNAKARRRAATAAAEAARAGEAKVADWAAWGQALGIPASADDAQHTAQQGAVNHQAALTGLPGERCKHCAARITARCSQPAGWVDWGA